MTSSMDRKVERPKWRSRRTLVAAASAAALCAALVLGVSLIGAGKRTVRVPSATVTVDTVASGVFHDITPLRGKVAPHDIIYLDALEGGQVREVMAHAGDVVTVGQPLLAFRNTELELEVLDREGRLVESITQLQAYEKQLEDARLANQKAAAEIDYNVERLGRAAGRRQSLVNSGYISAESNDQIHDELAYNQRIAPLQATSNARQEALRRRQLPEVRSELANLKQSLTITRAKLQDLVVRAPVSGQLTDLVDNVGENHNRGDRLGQVVPRTGFKVTAAVDEYYLARVRVGETASGEIDGRAWRLKVERVYPQVKDGVFTIDLAFVGAQPAGLIPGEAVDGRLTLGGDSDAVVAPAGAFLERTGGDWVMALAADSRSAVRRRIKIGRRNAQQVEILSGLHPGDRIVTSDYTGFENADRIDLTK
jgi:HlyD family secretion protein